MKSKVEKALDDFIETPDSEKEKEGEKGCL